MIRPVAAIIGTDFRETWRDRRVPLLFALCLLLAAISAVTAAERVSQYEQARAGAEATEQTTWLEQGEANPHTVAHYGHYAFRPMATLAGFDRGLSASLGSAIWMEGHYQTPAKNREAETMVDAQRFADLTPAWLLQIVAPLVIILIGFPLLARERETGLWRMLSASGVGRGTLLAGKTASLALLSLFTLAPLIVAAFAAPLLSDGAAYADQGVRVFGLVGAYLLYFLAFCAMTLGASALAKSSARALGIMLAIWILAVVVVPRLAANAADLAAPAPEAAQFWQQVAQDREQGVDGHNPRSESSEAFTQSVLDEYDVETVEDLPVNIIGLSMQADEEFGNVIYDRRFGELYDSYAAQRDLARPAALASPTLAMRELSSLLAGSDERHHRHFAAAAEAHRRVTIRVLNEDFAYNSSGADFSYMADRDLWEQVPLFSYDLPQLRDIGAFPVVALLTLIFWILLGFAVAIFGVRRWSVA